MDDASLTISLAMIAGVLAQGVAVHLRLPGIVVLLGVGVILGPDVANVVRPGIMGGGLQAFVGFAVAVILFEGGMSMNLARLRRQAVPIRRLLTIGVVVTAVGATIAARVVMPDWDWRLAALFGTLVIVTGPTVITPLLRTIKLKPNVATILSAEGIFIDAIGATIAVVALEAVIASAPNQAATGLFDVFYRLGLGALVGFAGGVFLWGLFRFRHVVPHGLENILALAVAVATFQISNSLVHESGITAAIIAGMVIGNVRPHAFDEIAEFKEQLTSFFVATLFVLLAADVRIESVVDLGAEGLITVLILMFVVRPATVLASTWGTDLSWREKAFLSWLAPRGIVAAAVASLFAIHLADAGIAGGVDLRALVFLVIAMTVVIQGISGGLVASLLNLQRPKNVGYLILGANVLARRLGQRLRDAGEVVTLVDSSSDACTVAESEGFDVIYGNGLESTTLLRGQADARKAVVALTPNESINFLFARKVRDSFKGVEPYVGLASELTGVTASMAEALSAHVLFGSEKPIAMWLHLLELDQVELESWQLDDPGDEPVAFAAAPANAMLPLLVHRDGAPVLIDGRTRMKKGDRLDVLLRPTQREHAHEWLTSSGLVPADAAELVVPEATARESSSPPA